MDLDTLKQILELVREHQLAELEFEQSGVRLKIRRDLPRTADPVVTLSAVAPATPVGPGPAVEAGGLPDPTELEFAVVKSPIVGTFYQAAEPGAPPLAAVGSLVKKGQVLCIIEAMKLMNEIDSEYDGEIVNVYVENGQPVQYGERLFAIRAT